MTNRNVSIIGGSTSGLLTAYLLAKQGLSVRLIEERQKIEPPSRTLVVTNYMRDLLGTIGNRSVINKIHHFELFTDGRSATISLKHPDLVIERSKLVRELAAEAENAGVELLTGTRFMGLKPNGKRLSLSVSRNGEIDEESVYIVVGADGAFSKVARSAGWPKKTTVPLNQAIVELPEDMPSHTTRVWFIPEDTPYFYWLIPHSATHGVLGMIGHEGSDAKRSLDTFLEKKNLVPTEFQSAQIPLYTQWIPNHRQFGENHVYLVGDAASHVKVTTVGGLITGFRGALGVVEAILNGGSTRSFKALHRELNGHHILRRMLNRFTQKDYNKLLDLLSPSTQQTLSLFTRDESFKLLLHLLRKQPRLLLLGLRVLLSGK